MECSMLILKPDGAKKIFKEVLCLIEKQDLEIVQIIQKKLSYNDAEFVFTSKDKEKYSNYMASGLIIIILVRGYNAGHTCRLIKYKLREKYNVTNKMQNLIHNADPGTEYYRQFTYFFPDKKITCFSGYANMLTDPKLLMDFEEKNSNCSKYGVVFTKETYNSLFEKWNHYKKNDNLIIGVAKDFLFENFKFTFIGYLHKNIDQKIVFSLLKQKNLKSFIYMCKKNEIIPVINFNYNVSNKINHDFFVKLEYYGVKGVNIFCKNIELHEIEKIEDKIQIETELFVSGGAMDSIADITIGEYEFNIGFSTIG